MVYAVYVKCLFLVVALAQLSSLTMAHADRHNRFLDLDLPLLNKLLVNIEQNPTTSQRTLAYLTTDMILRSGASNLQDLLSLYIPKQTRLNSNAYVVKVDGKVLAQADQPLPQIEMIKMVEFICAEHAVNNNSINVVAITTFK